MDARGAGLGTGGGGWRGASSPEPEEASRTLPQPQRARGPSAFVSVWLPRGQCVGPLPPPLSSRLAPPSPRHFWDWVWPQSWDGAILGHKRTQWCLAGLAMDHVGRTDIADVWGNGEAVGGNRFKEVL